MTPYGYVYRIRNKVNQKTYIGQRRLANDKSWRSYLGSGKLIKQAINKYGQINFIKEFIIYAENQSSLDDLEQKAIEAERAIGKAEYNMRLPGGRSYANWINLSPEQKAIASIRRSASLSGDLSPMRVTAARKYQVFIEDKQASLAARIETESLLEIISEFPENFREIKRLIEQNSIEPRFESKDNLSSEILKELYISKGFSANMIGWVYSCSGQTIRNYLRSYGVPIRKERQHAPMWKIAISSK